MLSNKSRVMRWLVAALIVLVAAGVTAYPHRYELLQSYHGLLAHFEKPRLQWQELPPGKAGIDEGRLAQWSAELTRRETSALLVVRGNRIVYEWYSLETGPNVAHYTAALAKPLLGISALLICLSDGLLVLDDPISRFVPALRDDPLRSKIRIRDLAFHSAGLDDVDFYAGAAGHLTGWKKRYYEDRHGRFRFALFKVPFLFPPGTHEKYAGIGYYALSYVLSRALQENGHGDLKMLLERRIMNPLGIPPQDWRLSYRESYDIDGMRLYAIGSGAGMTARAAARIAQLILDRGRWRGRQLLDARWIDEVLGRHSEGRPLISTNHGWILNVDGKWPSLPGDAILGLGGGQQLVLVVPSLDLVMVRYGEAMGDPGKKHHAFLDRTVFRPLVRAVIGASPRMERAEQ